MKITKYLGRGLLAACLLFSSHGAIAVTADGTPGASSTGTADISLTIPKLIRARGFASFTTASYPGTADINQNDNLNISTNFTAPTYKVTATASGGAFTLTDGSQTIPYNVFYNDVAGTTGRVALAYNTDLLGQSGAATTLAATTANANLSIQILQANLQAVSASTYTSTLTLVFTPL